MAPACLAVTSAVHSRQSRRETLPNNDGAKIRPMVHDNEGSTPVHSQALCTARDPCGGCLAKATDIQLHRHSRPAGYANVRKEHAS